MARPPRPITILYEDDRCLFAAKPPGLLTVRPPRGRETGANLVQRLRAELGGDLLAVHRLDQEASGVVLLARDAEARQLLMRAFKERRVAKTYLCVVAGRPRPASGTLRFPIRDRGATAEVHPRGRPAETRFRTVRAVGPASLLEVEPVTGRHNQIRIHLAHVGHSLVGERKYARGRDAVVRHKRAALHAARLALELPWSGRKVTVEAPLPVDLENLLARLEGRPGSR